MYKCPKCDYQSENPGNCPTDNEVLVEAISQENPTDEPNVGGEKGSEDASTKDKEA